MLDILAGIILPGATGKWISVKCLWSHWGMYSYGVKSTLYYYLHINICKSTQTFLFTPQPGKGRKSNKKRRFPICPSKTDGPGSITQPLLLPLPLPNPHNHCIHLGSDSPRKKKLPTTLYYPGENPVWLQLFALPLTRSGFERALAATSWVQSAL